MSGAASTATRTLGKRAPRVVAADAIRDLIVSRTYEPGRHLGEVELANSIGIKRQPVREALQALCAEGWIELMPDRGAFVHTPTWREVRDAFDVRGALEAEAVRAATPRATAAALSRLASLISAGRSGIRSGEARRIVACNARWHGALAALSGNALLVDTLASIDVRIQWYFQPVARLRGATSWDEHETILEEIRAGHAVRAAELMREHSDNTRAVYERSLA